MEDARIEEFVDTLVECWALDDDGDERVVKLTLHDLLMAVSRFEVMKDGQKALTMALCKKLQEHFDTKFSIKERKETKKKKNFPPNPLLKEKAKKETEEKQDTHTVGDADLEAFRKECLKYIGKYDQQMVANFYNYFTQRDANGKMRFQNEPYWDTGKRIEAWANNSNTINDAVAAERRQKQKKRQAVAQQHAEVNDRLWQQYADLKKGAVSHAEWLRMKEEEEAKKKEKA